MKKKDVSLLAPVVVRHCLSHDALLGVHLWSHATWLTADW